MKIEVVRSADKKTWKMGIVRGDQRCTVYEGASANKAHNLKDDLLDLIDGSKDAGIRAEVRRHEGKWGVYLLSSEENIVLVEAFGSHANAAADRAEQINAVLA